MNVQNAAGPIRLEDTVWQTIHRFPRTRGVFARHGMDTCCGGIHPIEMTARAHGVDPEALLAELAAAAREAS